ncbi:MAG: hypothetical protein M1830_001850, partial [Pleopsidium flavum]
MPDSPPTIKTRLCLLSDTHTQPPLPSTTTTHPYRLPLPRSDILLHAGDITMAGRVSEYETMLDVLQNADAELKIVIAGNHDITFDKEYYEEFGHVRHGGRKEDLERVRRMWCGEEARGRGVVYLEEGVRTFVLRSGARFTIYSSPYQPEFCHWAFAYERDEDRYNASPQGAKFQAPNPIPPWPQVDIMLTHGPPSRILDQTLRGENVGCENLLRAVKRCRPRLHCFGHIHEGWGAERVKWDDRKIESLEQDKQRMLDE